MGTKRTFWHEIIYKSTSLIPTFGSLHAVGLPKALVPTYIYMVVQMHWPWERKDWSLFLLCCAQLFHNFFKIPLRQYQLI